MKQEGDSTGDLPETSASRRPRSGRAFGGKTQIKKPPPAGNTPPTAPNHLLRGILEPSKMGPAVAENCRLQARHLNKVETRFLVLDLRVIRLGLGSPHLEQIGPRGQWASMRISRHSSGVSCRTSISVQLARSSTGRLLRLACYHDTGKGRVRNANNCQLDPCGIGRAYLPVGVRCAWWDMSVGALNALSISVAPYESGVASGQCSIIALKATTSGSMLLPWWMSSLE